MVDSHMPDQSDQPLLSHNADSSDGLSKGNSQTAQIWSFKHLKPLCQDSAYSYKVLVRWSSILSVVVLVLCIWEFASVGDVYLNTMSENYGFYFYNKSNLWELWNPNKEDVRRCKLDVGLSSNQPFLTDVCLWVVQVGLVWTLDDSFIIKVPQSSNLLLERCFSQRIQ